MVWVRAALHPARAMRTPSLSFRFVLALASCTYATNRVRKALLSKKSARPARWVKKLAQQADALGQTPRRLEGPFGVERLVRLLHMLAR